MKFNVELEIRASASEIWKVITDIENSATTISGIEKIEILEKGDDLIGLKWKETRNFFGKTADETMTITESVKEEYYIAEAESHGSKYISRLSITPQGEGCVLSMEFACYPQTLGAKITWLLMGFMLKGTMQKTMQQDLTDIKKFVEEKN